MKNIQTQFKDSVIVQQWEAHFDKALSLPQDPQFLTLLELNMESLTPFLEEWVLDNPFVDVDYYFEQVLPSLEKTQRRHQQNQGESAFNLHQMQQQSIETYLFEQIMLFRQTPIRDVMVHLVEFLDERGFITQHVDDIARELQQDFFTVLDALTLFKTLEPAGIGAANLRECLMLQAERDDHAPAISYYLLETHFEELVQKNFQKIIDQTSFTHDEITNVLNYLKTLHRENTNIFETTHQSYLVPDLLMMGDNQFQLQIIYHQQAAPHLVFNQSYFEQMQAEADDTLEAYLTEKHQQYLTYANYVRLREQLLLKVTAEIIRVQSDMILNNAPAMGLTMKDLANKTGIPQSYIVRLLTGKSLLYKNQIYVLSDFINHRYSTGRDGLSADYIRQKVQEVIANVENGQTKNIQKVLADQGITISGKVIEMYRQHQTSPSLTLTSKDKECSCGSDASHCQCQGDHECQCHETQNDQHIDSTDDSDS